MEPGELFNAIVEHFSWQIPSAREIGRLIGQLSRATSQRPKFLIVRELLGRKKVCRLSPEGVAVATGRAILEFGADGRMILVEVKETEIKDLSYLRAELEKLRTSLAEKDEANQALSKKLEQTETLTRQFEVKTRELEARQEALEQGLREAKAKMAEAEARIKEVEQRAKTEIAFRLSGEKNVLRLSIEAREAREYAERIESEKRELGLTLVQLQEDLEKKSSSQDKAHLLQKFRKENHELREEILSLQFELANNCHSCVFGKH